MEKLKVQEDQSATVEMLEAIGNAFNSHDLDAIMELFADDCVFYSPIGSDIWGRRVDGKEAIRAFHEQLFANVPDLHWEGTEAWVSGNKGCLGWRRTGTTVSGEKQDWLGCDLFEFRDGKITKKDAYFKIVQ